MSTNADRYDVMTMPVFSEDDVLRYGLTLATGRTDFRDNDSTFHALYGSSAKVLAEQFEDMQISENDKARLTRKDNSSKGLCSFLMAHHWLWAAPKNATLMATRFRVCVDYCQGKHLWKWIRRIAALAEEKIRLEDRFSGNLSVSYEVFTLLVDGTDFRCWEPKHPTLPIDTGYASHKFKSAGLRYKIALSVETGECVFISGPHPAGKHDMTVFREDLKSKIQPGEAIIADSGYQTSKADEEFMSTPNTQDRKEVAKFKSIVQCRHETFNGRLKKYASMDNTWRHGKEKHGWALRAVAVTVQYHLRFGGGLFKV